ncbi:MAG: tetratricopeptide repeat protein, partial [Acidobacteriota bacterium]
GVRLATIYLRQEKPEEALKVTRKLLTKENPSAEAFNLEGIALNKMKRFKEAAGSFQKALEIEPDNKVIMVNLAVAWLNNGEIEKARQYMERLLPSIEDQSLKDRVEDYLKQIKNLRGSVS